MNQNRYLQELAYYLRSLPKEVQDNIMAYYRDQFKQALEEGGSEEDTVLMLGRPKVNAEKEMAIYAEQTEPNRVEKVTDQLGYQENNSQESSYARSEPKRKQPINYFILILLIMFNVIVVLGPAIGLFFAGIGFWISSIVLMASPLLAFWVNGTLGFPEFYPILACVGFGILIFVVMHYVSQLATSVTKAYFKAMERLVRGN